MSRPRRGVLLCKARQQQKMHAMCQDWSWPRWTTWIGINVDYVTRLLACRIWARCSRNLRRESMQTWTSKDRWGRSRRQGRENKLTMIVLMIGSMSIMDKKMKNKRKTTLINAVLKMNDSPSTDNKWWTQVYRAYSYVPTWTPSIFLFSCASQSTVPARKHQPRTATALFAAEVATGACNLLLLPPFSPWIVLL